MNELIPSLLAALKLILDAPWKVAAVIILGVMGLSGSLIWDSKDVLIGVWARKPATLDVAKFEEWAPKLIQRYNASGAVLLKVDVERNEREVVYFATREGKRPEFNGFKGVLLATGGAAQDAAAIATAKLVTKVAFCDPSAPPISVFGQAREKAGLIVLCKAPIFDKEKLIGVVQLGFDKMPEDQFIVIDNLKIVAQTIKKD